MIGMDAGNEQSRKMVEAGHVENARFASICRTPEGYRPGFKLLWSSGRVAIRSSLLPGIVAFLFSCAAFLFPGWAGQGGEVFARQDGGIEMVRVEPGQFYRMGYGFNDQKYLLYRVQLTRPYFLGRTEVTVAQWKSIMGSVPHPEDINQNPNKPVVMVSFNEIQQFLRKLNASQNVYRFRLPTRAEWEMVARGRASEPSHQKRYFWGDEESVGYYWDYRQSEQRLQAVATTKPSPEGIYDLWGNVYEWTSDPRKSLRNYDFRAGSGATCRARYQEDYCYPEGHTLTDPMGEPGGQRFVIVGGGYLSNLYYLSWKVSAYRPDYKWETLGFRLAADAR